MKLPELLIPAGTPRKLEVAFAYGADAVYVGAAGFSMRPDEASFSIGALRECVPLAHALGKRLYVGVNTLVMQSELAALEQWLDKTGDIPFDALIVADPALVLLVQEKRPDVEIHISTQMSTANALAARFWKEAGAKRIVLARECTLEEVSQIARECDLPVEIFVHGSMCVAVSGRCLLSAYMTGHNASKGECKHSCRWQWEYEQSGEFEQSEEHEPQEETVMQGELREAKRPGESFPVIETEKNTIILSSSDLCLLEHIPQVVESGAASLKIEGRMKSEYYVAAVTRAYRSALDAYAANPQEYRFDPTWLDDVRSFRHHPYSTGFAFGYPRENPETLQASSIDMGTHDFAGLVESEKNDTYLIHVKHPFRQNETLEWFGPNMRGGTITIRSIVNQHGGTIPQAHPGTLVQITIDENVSLTKHDILRRAKKEKNILAQRIES